MADKVILTQEDRELVHKISAEVSWGLPSWGGGVSSLATLEPEVLKYRASFFLRYPSAEFENGDSTILVKIPREHSMASIAEAVSSGEQLADRAFNEFRLLKEIDWLVKKLKLTELAAVQPLFYLPEWNAIVMEELPSQSLEEIANDLRTRMSIPGHFQLFEDTLCRAGQWLRVFHEVLGGWELQAFDGDDFLGKVDRKINQLAPLVGSQLDLASLRSRFAKQLELIDGVDIPHVQLHGDYFFKNILVTADRRVAGIDLYLQKWGPIYRDLSTLLTEIIEQKLKFTSLGFFVRRQNLIRSEKSVLEGYFSNEKYNGRVLYVCCGLDILTMWYWYEDRYSSLSGPESSAAALLRPRIRQYLYHVAENYLEHAQSAQLVE